MSNATMLGLALLIATLLYKFIYTPLVLSPLRTIPAAHPISRFASTWIVWIRHTRQENTALLRLHRKLGPIILTAPNEISIDCVDNGIKTVYGASMDKEAWYDQFANYSIRTMFSTQDSKPHAARKRMISHVYSKSHLLTSRWMHTTVHEIFENRLLPILSKASARDEPIEMHEMFHAVTMDLFTGYAFGLRTSTNFVQQEDVLINWRRLYKHRTARNIFTRDLAPFAALVKRFGINLVPESHFSAIKSIESWFYDICENTDSLLQNGELEDGEGIVFRNLQSGLHKERAIGKHLDDSVDSAGLTCGTRDPVQKVVASELLDQCLAAHETSAIILTYYAYHISLQPKWQQKLSDELDTLPKNQDTPAMTDIDKLPILHATLMETLRLRASIPGAQPRISPHTGKTILGNGHQIPGGIKISAQAYTLHRQDSVFPNSEEWLPERWLVNETELREMYRWFWAFSSGGRMCIGSNLAMLEMKAALVAIYSKFTTKVDRSLDLEQQDGYTVGPVAEALNVWFSPRHSSRPMSAEAAPQVSTRVSIKWADRPAFEDTDTLTLTGSAGHYLDLRVFKTADAAGSLEWALAGKIANLDPDEQGRDRVHFQSVIDSHRTQMPKSVKDSAPPDIGSFSDLPDGDALEEGAMVNVANGYKVEPYQEIWRRFDLPSAPQSLFLAHKDDISQSFVGRVDRWCIAIRETAAGIGAWRYDLRDGKWTEVYRIERQIIDEVQFSQLDGLDGQVGDTVEWNGKRWQIIDK